MVEWETNGSKRVPRGVVVLTVAVVAAILGATAGAIVVKVGSSSSSSLTLEPADSVGSNPFTDSVAASATAFPGNVQTANAAVRAGFTKDDRTGALVASGTAPGLYGGSGDTHVCDPQQLVAFLAQDRTKAAAWASVFDIASDDIGGYVASLTPVLLTGDTLVTNHGFKNGKATSFQSVLQAGTAVMVDSSGVPRVKCNCGNPLAPPEAISLADVKMTGVMWADYSPSTVIVVQQSNPTTTLVLIDVHTGVTYDQPVTPTPTSRGTGGGMWVAAQAIPTVGVQYQGGSVIKTSPDGTTWTQVGSVAGANLTGLAFGDGVWVGVASSGTMSTIYKSGDLANWSAVASEGGSLTGVSYGNGRWVAVGSDEPGIATNGYVHSSRLAYTSTDAMTWTDVSMDNRSDAPFQTLSSVAFGDGGWTAIGFDQTSGSEYTLTTFRSTDGTNWQASGPPFASSTDQGAVAYRDHTWTVAVHPANPTISPISQSTDGYSWAPIQGTTPFADHPVDALAAGEPGLLAVSNDYSQGKAGGAPTFYASSDGMTWTPAGQLDTSVTALAFGGTGTTTSESTGTTAASGPPCTKDAIQAALQNTADATNVTAHCNGTWAAVAGITYKSGDEGNALFRANGDQWESGGSCTDPDIPPDIYQVACTSS